MNHIYTYASRFNNKKIYISSKILDSDMYRLIHVADERDTYEYLDTLKRYGYKVYDYTSTLP